MKKLLVVIAAAAMLTACDSIKEDNAAGSGAAGTEHFEGDGHDHGHHHDADDEHHDGDGHDHDAADGHTTGSEHEHAHGAGHHGADHDLGSATAAGVTFQVLQVGHGSEGQQAVEIILAEGSPAPKAFRVWIGNESAQGSMKTRAEGAGPAYEMHVEFPDPAPTEAKLWVEVENAAGQREAKSFKLIPETE